MYILKILICIYILKKNFTIKKKFLFYFNYLQTSKKINQKDEEKRGKKIIRN